MTYGEVHCFACGDYVYDAELENIAKRFCQKSSQTQGKPPNLSGFNLMN